jgi:hypothetical protein
MTREVASTPAVFSRPSLRHRACAMLTLANGDGDVGHDAWEASI